MRPSRLAVLGATTAGGRADRRPARPAYPVPCGHGQRATTVTVESHEIDVHVGPAGAADLHGRLRPLPAVDAPPARTRSRRSSPPTASAAARTTRPTSGRLRRARLRRALLHRPRLRRLRLQDHASTTRTTTARRPAAGRRTSAAARGPTTAAGSTTSARTATSHDGVGTAHDPRVGMIGGSYGGQIQFAVAGIDPRVDAHLPIITWNDLSYSLAPNNTELSTRPHGVTLRHPGRRRRSAGPPVLRRRHRRRHRRALGTDPTRNVGCPNFADDACAAEGAAGRPRLPRRGHPRASRGTPASRRTSTGSGSPTLLVQGENDTLFNLQEAVATYRALRAQGTADQDDLAVVGPLRQHAGAGRARPARTRSTSYEGQRFIALVRPLPRRTSARSPPARRSATSATGSPTRHRDPGLRHRAARVPGRRPPSDALPLRRRRPRHQQAAVHAGQRVLRQRWPARRRRPTARSSALAGRPRSRTASPRRTTPPAPSPPGPPRRWPHPWSRSGVRS